MKQLLNASFWIERFAVRAMGVGVALLTLTGLVAAIFLMKSDELSFEERVFPYVDCPDEAVQELIDVAKGKQVVRCKQNIPPGINRVLEVEAQEKVEAKQQAAQSSGGGSSRPAGCDRAELASRVISDYFYYGNPRSTEELDAALNAIAYFLEQNNYRFEAQAIDYSSSLDEAISVYSNLIPQLCS
jgi:hypothetical protein